MYDSQAEWLNEREEILTSLERANHLIEQNCFSEAYGILSELKEQLAQPDAAEYQDLRDDIEERIQEIGQSAPPVIETERTALDGLLDQRPQLTETITADVETEFYLAELDAIIDEKIARWEQAAHAHLETWERALIDGKSNPQYRLYSTKVNTWIQQTRDDLRAKGAIHLCELLWERAETVKQGGLHVAPGEIIRQYFDRARDIAREALANDPQNPDLAGLVNTADDKRELEAIGAQVITSGVRGGFYQRSLDELRAFGDEELVANYRFVPTEGSGVREILDGYIPAKTAREELIQQAAEWAHEMALEYLDKAERALKNHKPVLAQKALADRPKIDSFLQLADRADFDNLEQQVNQELAQYRRAVKLTQKARAELPGRPLTAWGFYEEARQKYEWAPKVDEARRDIIAALRGELEKTREAAQRAFNERDFARVRQFNAEAHHIYEDKLDPVLQEYLEQLQGLETQAQIYENELQKARADLIDFRDHAGGDVESMRRRLEKFERQYAHVLGDLPELAEVRLRYRAETELERLTRLVESQDLQLVRQGLSDAQTANNLYTADERFYRLAEALRLHLVFLTARREERLRQYEPALEGYAEVGQTSDHPDAEEATRCYEEIEAKVRTSEAVDAAIKQAQEDYSADPVAAYLLLAELGEISNRDQRAQRQQIMNEAKNRARGEITQRMNRWQTTANIPLVKVRRDLEHLSKLMLTDLYQQWSAKLEPKLLAQEARLAAERGAAENNAEALRSAISKFTEAANLAQSAGNRDEADRYRSQLNEARRKHTLIRLNALRTRLAEVGAENASIQGWIQEVRQELESLAQEFGADTNLVIWQAQLAEAIADNSLRPEDRFTHYSRSEALARRVLELAPGEAAQIEEASRLLEQGRRGVQIARFMQQIEQLFHPDKRSVQNLARALAIWEQEIQPHSETGHFRILPRWWNNLRAATIAELQAKLGDEIEFGRVAMILVLDPEDATARNIVDNLDNHQINRLRDQVKHLVANLYTVKGNPDEGLEILRAQREELAARLFDIHSLNDLAEFFVRDRRYRHLKAINDEVKQLGMQLKEAEDRLKTLEDSVQRVVTQLGNEQINGDFSSSHDILNKLRNFARHPAYRYVEAEVDRREKRRAELDIDLSEVRQKIEAEDYTDAINRMENQEVGELRSYGLADSFTITDPYTGILTRSWEHIYHLIQPRPDWLERVRVFAAIFDDYNTGVGRITGGHPIQKVVDWQAARQRIDAKLREGDFDRARRELEAALIKTGNPNILSLQLGDQESQYPPLAEAEELEKSDAARDPAQRWALAIKYAGTRDGHRMLLQTRDERLPYLRGCLEAAEATPDQIAHTQEQWETGWREWNRGMQEIDRVFKKIGYDRPAGRHKKDMRAAIDQAHDSKAKCRAACPEHVRLHEMEELWLYQQAKRCAEYDPEFDR